MTALLEADQACCTTQLRASEHHVIVRVADTLLGLPVQCVQSMVLVSQVTAIPNASAAVRGVLNLRGSVMTLLDLRALLGLRPLAAELEEISSLLKEREQDHRNWIAELQASLHEKRAFTLTRDPHKCKFGKWYDSFQWKNQGVAVLSLWRSFDAPHRRIHATADAVCDLAAQKRFAEAQAAIDSVKDTVLTELIRNFGLLSDLIRSNNREVAVVLRHAGAEIAIAADEVVATETFSGESIQDVSMSVMGSGTGLTPRVARRRDGEKIVALASVEGLFASACR